MAGPQPAAAREVWCQVAAEGLVVVALDNRDTGSTGQFRPWITLRGPIGASDLPYIFVFSPAITFPNLDPSIL